MALEEEKRIREINNFGEELLTQYHKSDAGMKRQLQQTMRDFVLDINDEALNYYRSGMWREALTLLDVSLEVAKTIRYRLGEGAVLNSLGEVYRFLGEYKQALEYYNQGLVIIREVKDIEGEGAFLNNIGVVYRLWGKYQQALEHYQEALKITKAVKDKVGEGTTLNNIGMVYRSWGKYQQALEYYEKSLKISRKSGDRKGEGRTLNNIGVIYRLRGKYQHALKHYHQALKIRREIRDRAGEGQTLSNIGVVYSSWGKYQQALEHYQETLKIVKEIGDKVGESTTLSNIGEIYRHWGKYQRALEHYQQALKPIREIGDSAGEATVLTNIGMVYYSWDKYQQALDYYEKSLNIEREIGDNAGEANVLGNIGQVYDSLGKYEQALNYYQQTLKIRRNAGDRAGEGIVLNNMGIIYDSWGKYQKALKHYQQALEITREVGNKTVEANILSNIGGVYAYLNRFKESFDVFKKSIDISELLIGETKSEEIRKEFRATKLFIFNSIVHILLDWYFSGGKGVEKPSDILFEAVKFIEMAKAREISDKLEPGKERVDLSVICPEYRKLVIKEQELTDELNDLYRAYHQENLTIATARARGETTDLDLVSRSISPNQLEQMSSELKKLRNEIQERCHDPGLVRQIMDFNPLPSFKKIFANCPNALIWEFFYDEKLTSDFFEILAWSKDDIELFRSTSFDSDTATKIFERFHKAMARKSFSKANENLVELSRLLGSWLPDALWQTIEGKDLLIVIPHERLHMLPWSIAEKPLVESTGNDSTNGSSLYLGLLIPIVRNYSLGLVDSCIKREKEMATKLLLISNPNFNIKAYDLPGADKEVNSVMELISSLTHPTEVIGVLRNKQASEEEFKSKIDEGPSIIHFAGHGCFDPDDPWLSHLRFYSKDGYSPYTVTEMILHSFPGSPLFVLSACETARGIITKGDEAVGIIRGLTLAHATTIIATNWLLDDRVAPHFMRYFYNYFLRGQTAAESLFNAQKELYEKENFKKPIHWAVYELYGNPFKTVKLH